MASWQNGKKSKLIKEQFGKMLSWQKGKLMILKIDKNCNLMKQQSDEMASL